MSDTIQHIFKGARRFFSGTAFSRVSGMLRDIVMAYTFGTTGAIAGFLVAYRLSQLLRRVLGEGALQAAFVPYFEELRKKGGGAEFFRDLTLSLSVVLIAIIALSFLVLSFVGGEIAYLTVLMLPGLFFICLYGLNSAYLQCHHSFFTSSVAPVFFNLVWVGGLIFLNGHDNAMVWLALFVVLAFAVQYSVTLPKVLSTLQVSWVEAKLFSKDVRKMTKPLLLGIIGIAATQVNTALDAIFARYASIEGPAYLWYAIRLQQLPLALFGVAISSALLPPLSRAIKADQKAKYVYFLNRAVQISFVIMIPMTFLFFIGGDQSIHLIFGYGDFNTESTLQTTWCLWAYSIGLVPMTLVLLFAPAFYAQSNYRVPMRGSILSVAINVSLNSIMVLILGWGATSVALATSLSAWVNCWYLSRQLTVLERVPVLSLVGSTLLGSALALGVGYLLLGEVTPWTILMGGIPSYPQQIFSKLGILLVEGACFCGVVTAAYFIPYLTLSHRSSRVHGV